jgi:catechol 2,3-dioxygenase-like lactoylglutathione lyase family enzyme
MLTAGHVTAFLATSRPEVARPFYEDILKLRFVSDDPFAISFDSNGTMLRVTKVPVFIPLPFTVLGWTVDDVAAELADLRSRGVVFERFPGMGQDGDGIWTAPGGARIAWFKDPDGNLLSLAQV